MLTVPVYDPTGQKIGEESIDPADFGGEINKQLLHDVVLMHMANRRVGTVNTRGRADVAGSGKKLFRQKGTGNARAGAKRTNKRKGGGMAFARRNRDYSYSIPKRAVRAAIRMAILSKFQDHQAIVIDGLKLDAPKTKPVAEAIAAIPSPDAKGSDKKLSGGSILIGTPGLDAVLFKSARNIDGVQVAPVAEFNTYDILKQKYLLLTREALEALKEKAKEPVRRRAAAGAAGPEADLPDSKTAGRASKRGTTGKKKLRGAAAKARAAQAGGA